MSIKHLFGHLIMKEFKHLIQQKGSLHFQYCLDCFFYHCQKLSLPDFHHIWNLIGTKLQIICIACIWSAMETFFWISSLFFFLSELWFKFLPHSFAFGNLYLRHCHAPFYLDLIFNSEYEKIYASSSKAKQSIFILFNSFMKLIEIFST